MRIKVCILYKSRNAIFFGLPKNTQIAKMMDKSNINVGVE